jgi:hypothetical protein
MIVPYSLLSLSVLPKGGSYDQSLSLAIYESCSLAGGSYGWSISLSITECCSLTGGTVVDPYTILSLNTVPSREGAIVVHISCYL